MTAPNPQYDAIMSVLAERNLNSNLLYYYLGPDTRYFVEDKEVICLGVYHALGVGIFGEWHGTAVQKPAVRPEDIGACKDLFFLRPATRQEIATHGGLKAIVLLQVLAAEASNPPGHYAAKIIFLPSQDVAFYNPVV